MALVIGVAIGPEERETFYPCQGSGVAKQSPFAARGNVFPLQFRAGGGRQRKLCFPAGCGT
jgi:hypothetical protein